MILDKPMVGIATQLLKSSGNRSLVARCTRNARTMSSFPSSATTNTTTNIQNKNNNHETTIFTKAQPQHLGGIPIALQTNPIQRRSMVTITQTKSSDPPSLFSSHVVDDVSSSPVPTYVVNEDSTLIVTESCLNQIELLLRQRRAREGQDADHDDGCFLRVFVDAGGCSGFQYQFEVDDDLDEDEDVVVVMAKLPKAGGDESDETVMRPRVVVDETSMGFLEGSTIDYVIEMIKSAFVVSDNPQSESACGCGSSFAMKNFEKFGAKD